MLTTKTLVVAIAAIAISSISAQAAERHSNPLHPAYFAERAIVDFQYIPTKNYVDAGNPLHPSYAKSAFCDEWIITAAIGGNAYVDSNNPLHPKFKR